MDTLPAVDASTAQGRRPLSSLRRDQRRLLFGGGGLLSLLVVATLLLAAVAEINDFHAGERQRFAEARSTLDYFLLQRDRAYASNINGNDAIWSGQQAHLQRQGEALAGRFLADGDAVLVRAEGRTAVPWLVLGRSGAELPRPLLDAYLGMMVEYSAYTAATVTALRAVGPVTMYAYEPEGRLLAVSGVSDEAQLLAALRVGSREEAFARLLVVENIARHVRPAAGPVQSASGGGRLQSRFDANPISGQPSLVGVQTVAEGRQPVFRRVVFEPVETIKARLEEAQPGAYLVVTRDGRSVLRSTAMPAGRAAALARSVAEGSIRADQRQRAEGQFVLAGPVEGVDWSILYSYGWADLWHDKGLRLLLQGLAALLILSALWWLLLRLDRRVFTPALADASRVYESEALSRVIIDTSPVGLVLIEQATGEPLVENELARQMASEAAGDDGGALYAQLAARARADDGRAAHDFQYSTRPSGAASKPRQLQVSMALAAYRERTVWVCALRDVTAQAELEQTLRLARQDAERARAAAESASRAKTAFVATMSHEIRTPLNGVLGHLELLGRSPMQPAQRERLDRIRLSADALLGIISDVLDFSKIEAGQLDIDPQPFAPRPLVEQAALLYSAEAQRKGVKLYYAVAAELEGRFEADLHRIRQVLNNLLGNAVKFTESGRIVVRAELLARPPGASPMLRLQVVDSGIGLAEAQLAQLFQPFQQADASISRRYGGSGLGLALCQQLARLLGGSIKAESTLGVGSVFTLEVPVTPLESAPPAPQPLRGRSITLLSAAAEWRTEIGSLLQRWGADVAVIEQPTLYTGSASAATLVLFGERRAWASDDEAALLARHATVVRAYPGGPLSPEQRDDGIHVSCYVAEALLRALVSAPDALDEPAPDLPAAAMPQRGRVLLVEDNPVNRELIQQQLEALGFAVDTAENGREGLAAWQPEQHLAVLTDINMPVMDGYALARELRRRSHDVPILAITATALASERERCRDAGISDLLLKPMSLETLGRALDAQLGSVRPAPTSAPAAVPLTSLLVLPDKLRRTFVESARDDMARIDDARARQDDVALLDRLHALKGVLMMLGQRDIGLRFGAAEAALRDQEPVSGTTLDALLADLHALVEQHAAQLPPADDS